MSLNPDPKTPKHQPNTVYSNTPRRVDPTCHPGLATAELNELRPALMHSMGETVPEVDINWFLQYAVPRLSSNGAYDEDIRIVQRVVTKLKSNIVKGRWKWYKEDPSKMQADEDTVFKHMESISDAVLKAGKQYLSNRDPTCRLRCLPRKIGKSEMVNSNFKGNGNQLLEQTTGAGKKGKDDFYIVDSAVNHEYKKWDDIAMVNANVVQLLGNSARILFSDPARRFRWSVSVENTTMRFWFLSRSVCFVSKPFNFVTQHKPFIHFLLATSFASKTDLGYDPTVRRKVVKQEGNDVVAYDYMVEDKTGGRQVWYRTVGGVISNHRANRPLGRAIRVWLVQELDDDGVPFGPNLVLKDYWITLDSLTEGQIQSKIFEAAAKACGNEDFKKYFMTILHDTIINIDGEEDSSPLHLGGATVPLAERLDLKKKAARKVPKAHIDSGHGDSTGGNEVPLPAEEPPLVKERKHKDAKHERHSYEPRKHARLVFKEVGTPLHKIKDQKVLFRCLIDALCGLEVFYYARWVHRDISTGNLLLCYDENDQPICKISDLEYARPYLLEVPAGAPEHAHKTGTPAFMAVEVQTKAHLFSRRKKTLASTKVPVLHNYLHDAESIWWIAIWHLFHTYPALKEHRGLSDDPEENISQQQSWADSIFPGNINGSAQRLLFFQGTGTYDDSTQSLLHSESFSEIMVEALLKLRDYYETVELPPENIYNHELFAGIHKALVPFFENAQDIGVEVEFCEYFHIVTPGQAAKKDNAIAEDSGSGDGSTSILRRGRNADSPVTQAVAGDSEASGDSPSSVRRRGRSAKSVAKQAVTGGSKASGNSPPLVPRRGRSGTSNQVAGDSGTTSKSPRQPIRRSARNARSTVNQMVAGGSGAAGSSRSAPRRRQVPTTNSAASPEVKSKGKRSQTDAEFATSSSKRRK
ncbi:hypothetical protein VNI00_015491 [Paramarasmius palmivorus]|uniref:Fungal-type protein kinase domain-containing protein n=1 Tax=Paramarasmius palmivorus TaxID=297713 RepID=A0AAW0BKX5_9AGAR